MARLGLPCPALQGSSGTRPPSGPLQLAPPLPLHDHGSVRGQAHRPTCDGESHRVARDRGAVDDRHRREGLVEVEVVRDEKPVTDLYLVSTQMGSLEGHAPSVGQPPVAPCTYGRDVLPPALANLPTGLDALDRLTGGGTPAALWLLGGRAGVGTGDLALGLARAAALRSGMAVSWISTWQQPEEVTEAVLLAEAGVLLHRAREEVLTSEQAERLRQVTDGVQRSRLMPRYVQAADIMNSVNEHVSRFSVVVIDRLPHLGAAELDDLRGLAERTTTWIVVVLPALARRAVHGLVRHAHLGVWVERPEVEDPSTDRAGEADLFLLRAGHRTPPPVTVAYVARYARFMNVHT